MTSIRCTSVSLLLLVAWVSQAAAQGSAPSMDFDVSPRSIAMGGASNALLWGDELNHWGNPALTGYVRGVRYEYGRAQLIPGLQPDVTFQSQVAKLGYRGIGAVMSGTPFPSGVELSYGDVAGFEGFEAVESWGFGVSAARMLAAATGGMLVSPVVTRQWDVGFGMNFKEIEVSGLPGEVERTTAEDWGAVLRFSPLLYENPESETGSQLDLAYGYSVLSGNDDAVLFGSRVTRHIRHGISARVAIHPEWLTLLEETPEGWLFAGLRPLLSIGATADWSEVAGSTPNSKHELSGQGLEVAVVNVLALRVGHRRDEAGGIEDATWGFAIGIPVGLLGGLRYESAWTPQAAGLDHRQHNGFSLWVDPVAAWDLQRKK
jgi:hypothetical protein